ALGEALLKRGSGDRADYAGDPDDRRVPRVDVPVGDCLNHDRDERDHDDRALALSRRLPLAVGEPENEKGDDYGPAADAEKATEDAGRGPDRDQLEAPGHGGRY